MSAVDAWWEDVGRSRDFVGVEVRWPTDLNVYTMPNTPGWVTVVIAGIRFVQPADRARRMLAALTEMLELAAPVDPKEQP